MEQSRSKNFEVISSEREKPEGKFLAFKAEACPLNLGHVQ